MRKKKVSAIAIKSFALLVVLGTAYQATGQGTTTPYPNMAPINQYLMPDQGAEIALARSTRPYLHQVGQRTFTSKLLSMPSTQRSRSAADASRV